MPRSLPLLALVAAIVLAAGCGGSDKKGADTGSSASVPPPASATGCKKAPAAKPRPAAKLPAPRGTLSPDRKWVVTVETNCGVFRIELDAGAAPKTSASFAYLARRHFYDGLSFHRIADGFVIQGGDPKGDGTGGPGYKVREAPAGNTRYVRGTVAMAKAGNEPRGTSGSQFFVVTGEDIGLPSDYALAGRVIQGIGAVDRIAAVPHDTSVGPGDGKPTQPVVISKMTLSSS